MKSEAISDYELYSQKRHDESVVKHGEYDEEMEEMMDKIVKLEKQVAELAKQLDDLRVMASEMIVLNDLHCKKLGKELEELKAKT